MSFFRIVNSNKTEILYTHLVHELAKPSPFPLPQRVVIVPSPAMKSWLAQRMAQDPEWRGCFGLSILYLDEAIDSLLPAKSRPAESTLISLSLETLLSSLGEQSAGCEGDEWIPILDYLKGSHQANRRLIHFADTVADLFNQYGIYGKRMIQEWVKTPSSHWQKSLWDLLRKKLPSWRFPAERVNEPLVDYPKGYLQLHLFAISFIPQIYYGLFQRLSMNACVTQYTLSPCAAFWSDILSDKQRIFYEKKLKIQNIASNQLQTLDQLLRDTNPLLANFGAIGRHMAKQAEETSAEQLDDYAIFEQKPALTLLESIQRDLLELRNPSEEEPLELDDADNSFQLHAAPSRSREVEIIYHQVLQLIDTGNASGDPILPEDIVVMAPDIMAYVPFIKSIFGSPGSMLGYQIMDIQIPLGNPLIETYIHLLRLPQSRWSAQDILSLVNNSHFASKSGLSAEDQTQIREWIQATRVDWGWDRAHCEALMKEDYKTAALKDHPFNWEDMQTMLIDLLVLPSEQANLSEIKIKNTDCEALGKFFLLLRRLHLTFLCGGWKTDKRTVKEWAQVLLDILYTFFSVDDDGGYSLLEGSLKGFLRLATDLPDEVFSFESIFLRLENDLGKKKVSYRENHLHAIRFCTLLPMRAIPSKIIIWMGLQEGEFPRQAVQQSLDLLKNNPCGDYKPTLTELDRYLFLETLLSTRKSFIISYLSQSPDSFDPLSPSLVVTELLHYLNTGYRLGQKLPSEACFYKHPFHGHDSVYFSTNSRFSSYSLDEYRTARAMQQETHNPAPAFVPALTSPTVNPVIPPVIDLKELAYFSTNPLRTYFHKTLGIYLNQEEEIPNDYELSFLEKEKLKEKTLSKNSEIELTDKKLRMPIGIFKHFALDDLQQSIEKQLGIYSSWGWQKPPLTMQFVFSTSCTKRKQVSDGVILLPALEIPIQGQNVRLTGALSQITERGILLKRKREPADAVKGLPQLLAYGSVCEEEGNKGGQTAFFLKDGTQLNFSSLHCRETLAHLIKWYLMGHSHPVVALPEWLDVYLEGSVKDVQNHISSLLANPFARFYNHYFSWAFPQGVTSLTEEYHEWSKALMTPVYNDYLALLESARKRKKHDSL